MSSACRRSRGSTTSSTSPLLGLFRLPLVPLSSRVVLSFSRHLPLSLSSPSLSGTYACRRGGVSRASAMSPASMSVCPSPRSRPLPVPPAWPEQTASTSLPSTRMAGEAVSPSARRHRVASKLPLQRRRVGVLGVLRLTRPASCFAPLPVVSLVPVPSGRGSSPSSQGRSCLSPRSRRPSPSRLHEHHVFASSIPSLRKVRPLRSPNWTFRRCRPVTPPASTCTVLARAPARRRARGALARSLS